MGNLILFGTLGFIFIFLLVHFILIHQWISSPLQLISNSLSDNDPEYIKPLLDKSNEFAAIALLIQNFFVQKDQLIQEIEERIRTEAKLKEAEEQTRKILLTSPEAIIVTDIRGKVLSINAEGLKILASKMKRVFCLILYLLRTLLRVGNYVLYTKCWQNYAKGFRLRIWK